jgi:prolyl oligopeptidase
MKTTISTSIAALLCATAFAQYNYPTTKKVEVSDTYYGITYTDNYRWLEDMKDSEVESLFKQQADFTDAIMNTINGRDELIAGWRKLDALQPATFSDLKKVVERIFFKKRMSGDNVGKIYYREKMDGKDILLFDPLNFKEGKTLSVESFIPSYDGRKLLIGYSESGAEIATLQVLDIDSKPFLKDSIPAARAATGWTFDSSAFMYLWTKSTNNNVVDGKLNPKTKLYTLGTDYTADDDFFSNSTYPNLSIPSKAYPYISLSKNAKDYVFADKGTVADELVLYYAPISQFNSGNIEWKTFCMATDKLINGSPNKGALPEVFGTRVYAITYNGAEKYKLIIKDLENPDRANAETVVAEKEMSLTGYTRSKDYLLLNYSDGINSQLFKFNPKTKQSTKITLPFSGAAQAKCLDTKTNDFIVEITSWNKPLTEFMLNADAQKFAVSIFNQPPVYNAEYNDLVVEEVEVKGHDGVLIPLSIIYKKGTKKTVPMSPFWQPGKFAAALQNSSTSGKPVLMKVNYDNGHFTEDREVTWANFTDQFAFVMWQTGHPDFQMKK